MCNKPPETKHIGFPPLHLPFAKHVPVDCPCKLKPRLQENVQVSPNTAVLAPLGHLRMPFIGGRHWTNETHKFM